MVESGSAGFALAKARECTKTILEKKRRSECNQLFYLSELAGSEALAKEKEWLKPCKSKGTLNLCCSFKSSSSIFLADIASRNREAG